MPHSVYTLCGNDNQCRVRKGTESQLDVILNKEARADSGFIGVCEAAVGSSGSCVTGACSVPALTLCEHACDICIYARGKRSLFVFASQFLSSCQVFCA